MELFETALAVCVRTETGTALAKAAPLRTRRDRGLLRILLALGPQRLPTVCVRNGKESRPVVAGGAFANSACSARTSDCRAKRRAVGQAPKGARGKSNVEHLSRPIRRTTLRARRPNSTTRWYIYSRE